MFHHVHIKRSLAVGMAIGITVLPAAAHADISATAAPGVLPAAVTSAPQHRLRTAAQAGFSWSDAGIGAGGGILLLGGGAASAVVMRRRRLVGAA